MESHGIFDEGREIGGLRQRGGGGFFFSWEEGRMGSLRGGRERGREGERYAGFEIMVILRMCDE